MPALGWFFALLLLLSGGAARAQTGSGGPPECSQDEKFGNTWYFGFKAGLDFNAAFDTIPPKVLTDGAMEAPAGAGVMSDGSGKILFYSNGETVWNGDGTVMTNGTGLLGSRLVTDGPLPIRMPGSPPPTMPGGETRYLLFTQDAKGGTNGLRYSEIIIPAGGGPGMVVDSTKNRLLVQGTAEKMTGVFHKNGCDIWIIVHGWGDAKSGNANRGDAFLAYRVKPADAMGRTVIDPPVISVVGSLHAPSVSPEGYRGQMKVTPDGQQLALARYSAVAGDSTSSVELFSFDTGTGQVGNPKIIDSKEGGYYGVEFSPGRSRLYATVLGAAPRLPQLLQFDISNIGSGTGPVGREVIPLKQKTPVNLGSMQAAPDGKIYVARENQPALGFIPYPDSLGAAIAYADDSLQLEGRLSGLGLVNFNQSSLLQFGFQGESTGCLEFTFKAPQVDFENPTYAWDFGDGTKSTAQNPPPHTYPAPGDYTVTLRVTTNCFCREATSLITVPGPPTPGTIAASQTICAGDSAAVLTSTAPAGEGTGQFDYQWQQSTDNSTWTDIAGATAETYAPGLLNTTTYFRRLVTSGFCAPRTPTASVKITVTPKVVPGTIAADQTVCAGTAPAPLTSTAAATGGTGSFTYQWESSLDNTTWTVISSATGATYAPGPLSVTTYFRRQASSGTCGPEASNVVTITVTPALTAGTIAADQTVCAGTAPAPFTSTAAPTGGTGQFTFQWESSPNNTNWTAIPGATAETYAPGALSVTTYFRRQVSSGSCTGVTSNVLTITVLPALTAGTIAADQAVCAGSPVAPLTSTAAPTGGTGQFTYQWESSLDQTTWAPVAGATNATYAPGPVTVTTYFRRQVSSGPCLMVPSNVVTISVLPTLTAGSIAADQSICTGTTPAPLTSAGPASGGTGTFAYQWESSVNNTTWTAIGGATGPTYAPGPLTTTTYFRRRVSSGTGTCATQVSNVVTVQVQAPVTPTVTLATPPTLCPGTPLTFTAVFTEAGAAPTFRWFVNDIPVASGPKFTSSTLVTGDKVRVEVTATAGLCSTGPATATVTVTRTPTPAPTLAIALQPDAPVCPGEPLTFRATAVTNAGPNPVYQWQVDGTNVAGATGPVFTSTALRDGQTVTLRLSTTNSCGQQLTSVSNGVVVRILPPVKLSAGPDKEIMRGSSVVLEGTSDGTGAVTWTPDGSLDFSGNDPLRPRASPTETTTYTLSAGTGGCAATDQVTVTVRDAIRIPNAFTPNGDGRDDTWQIEFIEQFPENTVTVFNRWGNQVFSAQNYSRANEWRGDINGKPAPVGTYYYVVVTKGPLGKSYSGSLTVLY